MLRNSLTSLKQLFFFFFLYKFVEGIKFSDFGSTFSMEYIYKLFRVMLLFTYVGALTCDLLKTFFCEK